MIWSFFGSIEPLTSVIKIDCDDGPHDCTEYAWLFQTNYLQNNRKKVISIYARGDIIVSLFISGSR